MHSVERSETSPSVEELLGRLSSGIEALSGLDSWERFLAGQSRFHRYSYSNTLLILAQRPDARSVAGFSTWRLLGRAVRKGERAIWIVAPLFRTSTRAGDKRQELQGFRRVAVFDVAQTEGPELIEVCRPLAGSDDEDHFVALSRVATRLGFAVVDAEMPPGMYGDCTYTTRSIRVSSTAFPAQRVKTLAHELSHAILHEGCVNRALAELEAESSAYVLCQYLGLDSSAYSFGYVATWAGGTATAVEEIRSSCGRISSAARQIIELLSEIDRTDDSCSVGGGLRVAEDR